MDVHVYFCRHVSVCRTVTMTGTVARFVPCLGKNASHNWASRVGLLLLDAFPMPTP